MYCTEDNKSLVMGLEDMDHRGYGNLKMLVIYISLIIFIIYKNGSSIINTDPILHTLFYIFVKSFLTIFILTIKNLINEKLLIQIFN